MRIKEVMTRIDKPESIVSVDVNDKMNDALKKFRTSGKSRIVVEQNNIPIKILRLSDMVRFKPNIKINKIIQNLDSINRVSSDDDIQKVISAQDCQPITIVFDKTNNNPIGIITPSDIVRYVKEQKDTEKTYS